jgi:DNA-binding transcriptional regulator YbjK
LVRSLAEGWTFVSYFFASLDDLMAAALAVVADRVATRLEESVRTVVRTNLTAEEAIDQFIDTLLGSPSDDVAAQFEIYLECARRPRLQERRLLDHRRTPATGGGTDRWSAAPGSAMSPTKAPRG